jgi:hypothetical protein
MCSAAGTSRSCVVAASDLPSRHSEPAPFECPDGICDRLQIAEWDVETLKLEREAAILSATMEIREENRILSRALSLACKRFRDSHAFKDDCLRRAGEELKREASDAF